MAPKSGLLSVIVPFLVLLYIEQTSAGSTPISFHQSRTPAPEPEVHVLPNFYSHIVSNRDEYKLIVPRQYDFVQLANRIPPDVMDPQVSRRLLSSTSSTNASINESKLVVNGKNSTSTSCQLPFSEHITLNKNTTDLTLRALKKLQYGMSLNETKGIKKSSEKTMKIGDFSISADRVISVGDIYDNGAIDYVVSNTDANGKRGSIRLYLMVKGGKNNFMYSRELIPGKCGLKASPLNANDRYGSVTASLPVEPSARYSLLALASRTHVYVLKLSDKGNVTTNVRLPWETFDHLVSEYERAAGVQDKSFDDQSAFMDAIDSVRTLVFRGPGGVIRVALRVDDEKGHNLLHVIDQFIAYAPISCMQLTGIWKPTVCVLIDENMNTEPSRSIDRQPFPFKVKAKCLFSQTECTCALLAPAQNSLSCYQPTGSPDADGRLACHLRDCAPSYKCMCDGNEICSREEKTLTVYKAVSTEENDQMLCVKQERTQLTMRPKEETEQPPSAPRLGGPVPLPDILPSSSLQTSPSPSAEISPSSSPEMSPPTPTLSASSAFDFSKESTFNATHCICSPPPPDAPTTTECLHYFNTIEKEAIFCRIGQCPASVGYSCDSLGRHYCSRKLMLQDIYVNDGEVEDHPMRLFCHLEHIKRWHITQLV